MKHVRRICAVLLAAGVLLPVVLLCVQAFVPPFDALMISAGSEPLRLLPHPVFRGAVADAIQPVHLLAGVLEQPDLDGGGVRRAGHGRILRRLCAGEVPGRGGAWRLRACIR